MPRAMRRWKIKVGQIVACSFCGEWFNFTSVYCLAWRRLRRRLFFRDAILRPAIAACRGRQGTMRRPARFETGRLGRGEQVTIAERIPTAIFGTRGMRKSRRTRYLVARKALA